METNDVIEKIASALAGIAIGVTAILGVLRKRKNTPPKEVNGNGGNGSAWAVAREVVDDSQDRLTALFDRESAAHAKTLDLLEKTRSENLELRGRLRDAESDKREVERSNKALTMDLERLNAVIERLKGELYPDE